MPQPSIVWFRDDLRIADHPALSAAIDRGAPVVCVFVLDEVSPGIRPLGGAARWWLHGSLEALGADLEGAGARLVLRRGAAAEELPALVRETGADAVFWNRRYGPERAVDAKLMAALREDGVEVTSFPGSLLYEPASVQTGSGTPYSVYTPYRRALRALPTPRAPLPGHRVVPGSGKRLPSDALADWDLLPTHPDWAGGLRAEWEPGERAARARLRAFVRDGLADYETARDDIGSGVTSRLSPRLRWGELSPYTVWHETAGEPGSEGFLGELAWREFAWHVLFHFPDLATRNWRASFDAFPWRRRHPAEVRAWQRGETGVPLVDAGMRELWETGIMHNRVRMVTASFLTKNLLHDWRIGEQWFWDTLVDADAANNPFNWQWVAGSGADAAPYFRVFNPETQAKKFDPHGEYVRRWAPDSADREPLVDLGETRRRALAAYDEMRRAPRPE
jgi:deoxyribodipyrimidine photo-lyase